VVLEGRLVSSARTAPFRGLETASKRKITVIGAARAAAVDPAVPGRLLEDRAAVDLVAVKAANRWLQEISYESLFEGGKRCLCV
jgi:hypothetical protein